MSHQDYETSSDINQEDAVHSKDNQIIDVGHNMYFWTEELILAVASTTVVISAIYLYVTLDVEKEVTERNVNYLVDGLTNDLTEYVGQDTIARNQSAIQSQLTLSPENQSKLSQSDISVTNNNETLKQELITSVSVFAVLCVTIVLILVIIDVNRPGVKQYAFMLGKVFITCLMTALVYIVFQFTIPLNFRAADTNAVKSDMIAASLKYANLPLNPNETPEEKS